MAIENGVQNAELGYILDPAFQIENLNGKPVVGGWICVYEAGTDNKYISYENFDGAQNPFKIPLKADGRAVILGDPSLTYDVYAYDSYGNQLFSRLNVQCNVPGNISISGADTRIKNTDGTLDISLQTMGNNVREYTVNTRNKLLDVQDPLYFVENSTSATIIGIKGSASGYVTKDYVDSAVSGKLDTTAFSTVSGDFLTDKFEYDDNFNVTGYNGSAFASNGQTYSAGTNIDITDNVISVTGLPDSADVENAINSAIEEVENKFEYNINNYITAYNNSAFAGTDYNAGDYVSIENDTISVTGLQPSGDYATHDDLTAYQPSGDYATKTELESATSGKMDVTGMTAYQPTGDYATHDDLTAYQPAGDYYSASNPSGFITNDALTGLQPSGDYATKEDVESATSGKQDTLSAGDGISIVNNTISVTSQGGGIEQVNHDDTLSGNGNSTPLGIANIEDFVKHDDLTAYQEKGDYYSASNPSGFITNDALTGLQPSGDYVTHDEMTAYQPTGDYTTHDDLTAYATTSLVSSVSSELYSAISGISGDYELVAGEGVELVDDTNAKTTTINVTAEGTPVTAIEQMIESATSGISAAISGSYTLVAGDGIQLTDDDNARTTTVSVSGDYLSASESANYYPMTANPSGFISEVPDTYLQNTDLTITDGKVTEISGVPLSAGGSSDTGSYIDYYNKPNTTASQVRASGSSLIASDIKSYGADTQYFQITPAGFNAIYGGTAYAMLNPGGLTAVGLTASPYNGLLGKYITANSTGLLGSTFSAGADGSRGGLTASAVLTADSDHLVTRYAELNSFSFTNGTITAGTDGDLSWPHIESSGTRGHLYIDSEGCRYTDSSGNVIWNALAANTMSSYSQTTPLFICPGTKDSWPNMSASAPYMYSDNLGGLTWAAQFNNSEVNVTWTGVTTKNVGITANSADVIASGVSLTGLHDAVHISMIEGDSATSAITAIAGSAIAADTSNLLTVDDASAFYTTANESGFITDADLTPYQTVADMTAYQAAGDYYSASNPSGFITSADITGKLDSSAFTSYTASVIPTQLVATSADATGTNILYVVTGE